MLSEGVARRVPKVDNPSVGRIVDSKSLVDLPNYVGEAANACPALIHGLC
jgi:hypothetical protein